MQTPFVSGAQQRFENALSVIMESKSRWMHGCVVTTCPNQFRVT
jgi:hypothetical protein